MGRIVHEGGSAPEPPERIGPRGRFTRACRYGFAAHLALVLAIGAGAYLGRLPTELASVAEADKILHFLLIGMLAFFLDGALGFRPVAGERHPSVPAWLRLAPVLILAAAGIEELLQALSPRRSASVLDYAADFAGVVVCSWSSRRL